MKLTELDPRFFQFESGGPVVGLTFECPHCFDPAKGYSLTRVGVSFHERGKEAIEDQYIHAHASASDPFFNMIWTIDVEDFSTCSITPSIDMSKAGHWHGYITNGEAQ